MIKIAVPDNRLYSNLYSRWQQVGDLYKLDVRTLTESKVSNLMLSNQVDLALLNPQSYGIAVNRADYRIIPGPALSTQDYTGILSLFFKKGLHTISKCGISDNDDFFSEIAKILLAENFNIYPDYIISNAFNEEESNIPFGCDSAIVWKESTAAENALDISEEWYQNYEIPLPLLFWVCRAETLHTNLDDLIRSISNDELLREENVYDATVDNEKTGRRYGKLIWHWNEEIEYALSQVLELLYYHQLLPEIADVKIMGRD